MSDHTPPQASTSVAAGQLLGGDDRAQFDGTYRRAAHDTGAVIRLALEDARGHADPAADWDTFVARAADQIALRLSITS